MTVDDALFSMLDSSPEVREPLRDEPDAPVISVTVKPWRILQEALAAVDAAGHVHPEHLSFVSVAAVVDLSDWTPNVAIAASDLLTGPYRDVLEASGWDVDLFPRPRNLNRAPSTGYHPLASVGSADEPVQDTSVATAADTTAANPSATLTPTTTTPTPGAPTVAVEDLVVLRSDNPTQVTLSAAVGHPARTAASALPGARWDGERQLWCLPVARDTALALRGFLTGHKVGIDKDTAARLKAAADTDPAAQAPTVTLTGGRIEFRFTHTIDRQTDVKRFASADWEGDAGCWVATEANAIGAIKFATTHGLRVADEVTALAAVRDTPFDYDGTIDGLRGVPLSELAFVRAVPARNIGRKNEVPSLEDRLVEYGIDSVYDLLMTIPFRYQDRKKQVPIRDLKVGDERVGFLARVTKVGQYDRVKRMIRFTVADGTGDLTITFFNMPWLMHRFRVGDEVVVFGRVDVWNGGARPVKQMTNPLMDPVGDDTALIVPVYPQSEKSKVTTWDIHGAAMEAVRRLGDLQDPIPTDLKETHGFIDRSDAYKQVHLPDTVELAEYARTRLAFDELFRMQTALGLRRHATADETGVVHTPTGVLVDQFLGGLRFTPTGAQSRALAEIREDLLRPHPMHRLLQGDVGSGKSLVSFVSLLMGVEGGYQGALMAPTEILATQLHAELADELAKIAHPDGRMLVVDFLGGKTRVKERRRILAGLTDGSIDIVVGTHALLVDEVEFANLGVVVIDEQHRFGVEQRAALRAKGNAGTPDMLVMTATPIPRTSALTVFGDLSMSILDELPPGRTPIATTWLQGEPELDVITGPPWDAVRSEVEAGRQAYIVASLVEDNEKIAAASAEAAMESLQAGALVGLRLGLVHGKQPREERETTMAAFKRGELDVLVATTVIEVGVNVPNATVMVILDATRFGISTLHQIRGRVGRGQHASRCILTGKAGSGDAVQRMQALVASTDGFYLSEVDLNLRGEGSIFGSRQSGQTDLRVASLKTDKDLLIVARNEADRLLDGDPKLLRRPGIRNEVMSSIGEDAQEWLTKS